jgi:hypothetical protein
MPVAAVLLTFLAVAAQAPVPPADAITIVGHAGPPFISPMGQPFRARTPGQDTLADWFHQADRNHDGALTVDEMEADAERFFATLDTNGDGQIDPDELKRYEWQVAPEIQVGSRFRSARAALSGEHGRDESKRRDLGSDGLDAGLQGGARYTLLNIPEPVSAADADLDRAVSRNEFRQAAIERFQLLDTKRLGKLTLPDLEALRPPEPAPGHHAKHKDDSADTRYGVPLPPGN